MKLRSRPEKREQKAGTRLLIDDVISIVSEAVRYHHNFSDPLSVARGSLQTLEITGQIHDFVADTLRASGNPFFKNSRGIEIAVEMNDDNSWTTFIVFY